MAVIFPKTLKKGDKIAVVSPAGSVEEGQIFALYLFGYRDISFDRFGKNLLGETISQ